MGKRRIVNGADALVASLEELGVSCVFGYPGGQNVELFESLRTSDIRTVLATSETTAGFMANGWFRATGKPGVYLAILGPGFAWAMPPLAEAVLDSDATILITGKPLNRGFKRDLHVIDQAGLAGALNCPVFDVDSLDSLPETVQLAWSASRENGARPVVIQIATPLLEQGWRNGRLEPIARETRPHGADPINEVLARLGQASRPVIYAGAGTLNHADSLQKLLDATGAVLLATPTARGVIPESHPRCLALDFVCHGVDVANQIFESSDLVIALGCRFSHNGTGGFGIRLDKEKLVHVDADSDVLQGNYPARWSLHMDVGQFLDDTLNHFRNQDSHGLAGWQRSDIEAWRNQLCEQTKPLQDELLWQSNGDCASLFRLIRAGVPDDGIIVTDTGLHQILTRTHLDVLIARGLIFPSDLQSMGYGLPAAIGAALSAPGRAVVALIGDGSFLMVGTELLTAKREELSLPVLVFCDGNLGQIRLQQIERFGYESATRLQPVNLAMFCQSLGVDYELGTADLTDQLRLALARNGPTVIEIQIADSETLIASRRNRRIKNALKKAIGHGPVELLKRLKRSTTE